MTPETSRQAITPSATGSVLGMRLWLSRSMLRPGAAWAALAGCIVGGILTESTPEVWIAALFIILLVDPIWGGLWDLLTGDHTRPGPPSAAVHRQHAWLPYLQPGSPAARLMAWLPVGRVAVEMWRSLLPMLALAAIISLVLGWPAIVATLLVLGMAGLGWAARRSGAPAYGLLQSLALGGLPYALAVVHFVSIDHPGLSFMLLLGLGLALVLWGMDYRPGEIHRGLLALGSFLFVGLPAYVQSPLWAGLLAALLVPAWWLTPWCDGLVERHAWWLRWTSHWWLAAILASAWAIRL